MASYNTQLVRHQMIHHTSRNLSKKIIQIWISRTSCYAICFKNRWNYTLNLVFGQLTTHVYPQIHQFQARNSDLKFECYLLIWKINPNMPLDLKRKYHNLALRSSMKLEWWRKSTSNTICSNFKVWEKWKNAEQFWDLETRERERERERERALAQNEASNLYCVQNHEGSLVFAPEIRYLQKCDKNGIFGMAGILGLFMLACVLVSWNLSGGSAHVMESSSLPKMRKI